MDSLEIVAGKKGKGKNYDSSHMDQIGFMITDIDDEGLLRFTNIGGIIYYLKSTGSI